LTPLIPHHLSTVTVLATAVLLATAQSAASQLLVAPDTPTTVELQPSQTKTLQVSGAPRSLQVLDVELQGGLIGLQSTETVRRLLDLGRGGHLLFAVEVPANGIANVTFTSGEHLRNAAVSVRVVTGDYTQEQRVHLRAAGIAFALADSARRRQPNAPDVATALKDYEQAASEATAADNFTLARWAVTQKARFLLYQKSSFVETRQLLERAAALPDAGDAAVQALLYKTLSSCQYFLGNLPQSVADGEHALALYRQTGDRYWQGIVLGNLIAGYGELGRNDDAAAAAREALTDAEDTQDTAGVVFCLTELANLYRKEGSLQQAFQSFREAQVWARDIRYAPLVQAEIEIALAQFYMELGLWTEAQEQLEHCLQHASPNSVSALEARGLLARTADRRGDLIGSLREYDSAITAARKLKLAPEETGLLLERSGTLLRAHRAAAALEDARNAAHLAEQRDSPSLRIQAALAEGAACLEACSDASQSAQIYQKALAEIQQTGEREQESVAYAGLARVHAALDEHEAGLVAVEHAMDLLEHSRASFDDHNVAASYFIERRNWYALATDLAARFDHLEPGKGYAEQAFQFSERARARAMLDALGDPDLGGLHQNSASPASAELLRRIAANEYQIQTQRAQLLSDADPRKTASALRILYRNQDALDTERRKQPAKNSLTTLDEFASIAQIQGGLLNARTALLSISAGQHVSYRWLITHTSVHMDVLPSMDELDHRLAPLQRALHQRRPAPQAGEDAVAYAARVSGFEKQREIELQRAGALLLPAIPRNIRHLYIVADGALQTVPWNVLRTTCNGRACYAIERYTVSLEPSASVAVALAKRPLRSGRTGVLVVSDTLPGNDPLVPRWKALDSLPGSQREAQSIARLVPAKDFKNLRRTEATVGNISHVLEGDVSVLHLAAHTLLVAGHPELSGIALSAGRDTAKPGQSILWLHDITHLVAPPLVVLSGCTTQGADLSGEELNTLTQAFFYAGAQQVVASNWQVDDDATVNLMQYFYRNLMTAKMPVADALRSAQLHMLARQTDLSDWAAFLVDGVPAQAGLPESVRR
jgi:CHAT domain-containing protein